MNISRSSGRRAPGTHWARRDRKAWGAPGSTQAADTLTRCGDLRKMYGTIETTFQSASQRVIMVAGRVPLGITPVYLPEENRNLVPAGQTGELYISGVGLARLGSASAHSQEGGLRPWTYIGEAHASN